MEHGTKITGILIFLILGLTLLTCRTQTDVLSTVYGDNLLQNPSFEENGNSSSAFWKIHNYPGFQFAKDAPSACPQAGHHPLFTFPRPFPHQPTCGIFNFLSGQRIR